MKRLAVLAFIIGSAAAASAGEIVGEPSGLACTEFRGEMARVLGSAPDALQVNNLLFDAAKKGCVGSLDALLNAGASRLARDHVGDTALAIAARMGRLAFVKALLDGASAGDAAQLDRANVAGSTPLIQAAQANRLEVAKWLIDAGADVSAVNKQGETALSAAAFAGDAELAELLLAHKSRADTVDTSGKSVIVYAAARGATAIVERLLDAGIDPNARYRADLTALMWAAGHADNTSLQAGVQTVKLLLSRGAQVDLVDDRGRNALMIAAGLGHAEIARVLLDAGADRTLRDKAGKSAADLSSTPEVKEIVAAP